MNTEPALLLTGASGQLGTTLQTLWQDCELRGRWCLLPADRAALDITDSAAVAGLTRGRAIGAIVNCAAYTAVDQAEQETELAFAVNEQAPGNLARAARELGCPLIHISTDYVFAGTATRPYTPDDETDPLGVYGRSKLAGEQAVREIWPERSIILRASWVYSPYGKNFLLTMLRLMNQRDSLSVVDDQVGSPTSTFSLARVILAALATDAAHGTYHWCDGSAISWFQFARAIQQEALQIGLLTREIPIHPIPSSQYPTPAQRPGYSVLDVSATQAAFECPRQDWRGELRRVLARLLETRDNSSAGAQ